MREPTVANEVAAVPRVTTADATERALRGGRLDLREFLFGGTLLLALLLALAVLVTLIADIFATGVATISGRGIDFLTSNLSSIPSRAGVWQGVVGSFILMLFVVVLSIPLGIGAAVYIEEYAENTRFTRLVTANIRNLAGVPSVVYGLLGLAIFVRLAGNLTGGRSVISGGLTMAILVLPIVIITSAEALRAVPTSIREAGFGVGGTRWEVVRSHVLPYAAPGIFTGTVLSLARALGETAPLILVGAVTGFFASGTGGLGEQLRGPYTALPTIVYAWSRRSLRAFGESTSAAIMVLLVVLLAVNATAIMLRNRYERKW